MLNAILYFRINTSYCKISCKNKIIITIQNIGVPLNIRFKIVIQIHNFNYNSNSKLQNILPIQALQIMSQIQNVRL